MSSYINKQTGLFFIIIMSTMNHDQRPVGELWNAIDEHIEEYTSKNVDATARIIVIAENARRVGENTLNELGIQGQKLLNIRRKGAEIEESVKRSKTMLTRSFINCSCFLACCGWFTSDTDKSVEITTSTSARDKKVISVQPLKSKINQSKTALSLRNSETKPQDELDRNLRTISLILDDLSNISKDMGDELDCQNELIADTIKQSTNITCELQSVNRLTKYLL